MSKNHTNGSKVSPADKITRIHLQYRLFVEDCYLTFLRFINGFHQTVIHVDTTKIIHIHFYIASLILRLIEKVKPHSHHNIPYMGLSAPQTRCASWHTQFIPMWWFPPSLPWQSATGDVVAVFYILTRSFPKACLPHSSCCLPFLSPPHVLYKIICRSHDLGNTICSEV